MTETQRECVFGIVCEQEGKCAMSSDGKSFRGALYICGVCVCSPHAMTFHSMRTFISL